MRNLSEQEYWLSKLNVHLDHIKKQFLLHPEQEIDSLARKWDQRICDLAVRELGFNGLGYDDQSNFVKALIESYPEASWQFIYLTEFAKRKRKDAVINVAGEKLHPDLLATLELDRRKPSAKDILWLICELFCEEPEALVDVYLEDIEKKHSTGTWFKILFDGSSIKLDDLAKMLDKESIKDALSKLDIPDAISCPKVSYREDEKVLFFNAEITAKILKLRESRNQGYTDDWIIVRLNKKQNRIRIATASLDKGAEIVRGLIQTVSHVECTLREEDEATSARTIKKFINVLLKDKKDSDTLREIELDNIPIDGVGVKIRLKNDFSIAKPLSALSGRYAWLEKVDDMRHILYLRFMHNDGEFKLTFDWNDDSPLTCFVRWDDSHVDSDFQEEFKQYMQDNYEIKICCKRRRFDSNSAA